MHRGEVLFETANIYLEKIKRTTVAVKPGTYFGSYLIGREMFVIHRRFFLARAVGTYRAKYVPLRHDLQFFSQQIQRLRDIHPKYFWKETFFSPSSFPWIIFSFSHLILLLPFLFLSSWEKKGRLCNSTSTEGTSEQAKVKFRMAPASTVAQSKRRLP